MSEAREIRDPVFNFISLNATEADIVNSSVFQRLRGIRQLAFANLVYPGALHTRFEHSLGVCHVAGLMANALGIKPNEDEYRLLRYAALLHDIGHGPFSHISEDLLEIYSQTDGQKKTYKIHETITADIINIYYNELCLSQQEKDKVVKLLNTGYGDPMLRAIVSGPLDADKQDYLLRDSYFCGVKYGVFDLNQLHRELMILDDKKHSEKYLMVSDDGIHALEQFFLAKYYITNQVYRHRVRMITDQMLIRAIVLGIDHDDIDPLKKLYCYRSDSEYLGNYLDWDDAKLMVTLTGEKYQGSKCGFLLNQLKKRSLLKRIYKKQVKELPEACRDPISGISKPENKDLRSRLEAHLWETVCEGVKKCKTDLTCSPEDSHYLIVHNYKIKSAREMSRNDEASIPVKKKAAPSTFEMESTLFNSINEKLKQEFVEIYAPVKHETPVAREKLERWISEAITTQIEIFFDGEKNATP